MSSWTTEDQDRCNELLCELRDGLLSAERAAELEQLVIDRTEARQAYVRYMALQTDLRWMLGATASSVQQQSVPRSVPYAGRVAGWGFYVAAAALVLLTLTIGVWQSWRVFERSQIATMHLAELTNTVGCAWQTFPGAAAGHEPRLGATIVAGRMVLLTGVAKLSFHAGAELLLEAPAELEVVDGTKVFLRTGQLVTRVMRPEVNFVVETPQTRILDLGTEFGVGVEETGATLVQVFDGAVEVGSPTGAREAMVRLDAGRAVEWNTAAGDAPQEAAFSLNRFVRRLPDPPTKPYGQILPAGLIPYNRDRTTSVDVLWSNEPPVIDGDWSEWSNEATLRSVAAEPYSRDYYLEGRLRYDAENLYIAAHVGDPVPLRSTVDPTSDAERGWRGGSVQLRLSTDAALGWPLTTERDDVRRGKANDNLVDLAMWYFRPRGEACLLVRHGLSRAKETAQPEGFVGAFRSDADGHGYTLEYAIPWRLICQAPRPPAPGNTAAACWQVNWADDDGRVWKGYLLDVLNPDVVRGLPDQTTQAFARPSTWGRAEYRPPGFGR